MDTAWILAHPMPASCSTGPAGTKAGYWVVSWKDLPSAEQEGSYTCNQLHQNSVVPVLEGRRRLEDRKEQGTCDVSCAAEPGEPGPLLSTQHYISRLKLPLPWQVYPCRKGPYCFSL